MSRAVMQQALEWLEGSHASDPSDIAQGLRAALAQHECAHELFKAGDGGIPSAILDRNGEVVLACCKKCGKAESELTVAQPAPVAQPLTDEQWKEYLLRNASTAVLAISCVPGQSIQTSGKMVLLHAANELRKLVERAHKIGGPL